MTTSASWQRPFRFWRHLVTDHWVARRAFPPAVLHRIQRAIAAGERRHVGQVCFAVEAALPLPLALRGESPRARAVEMFARLRVWDTEHDCGVLVYMLLADKDVEIVADRGIHAKVGEAAWREICRTMEAAFRERRFDDGAVAGIEAISALLAAHFPRDGESANELSDRPVML
ncbi:MAG: TPM domain-containing protein [Casimicrobiaceae bacterium]